MEHNDQSLLTGFYVHEVDSVRANFPQRKNVRTIEGPVPDSLDASPPSSEHELRFTGGCGLQFPLGPADACPFILLEECSIVRVHLPDCFYELPPGLGRHPPRLVLGHIEHLYLGPHRQRHRLIAGSQEPSLDPLSPVST